MPSYWQEHGKGMTRVLQYSGMYSSMLYHILWPQFVLVKRIPKPQLENYCHWGALSYRAWVEHKVAIRRYRMQQRVELLDCG